MGASGRTTITFGAAPGGDSASVAITGQSAILSSSACEAYLDATGTGTSDHSVDEHIMAAADLDFTCSAIVAGTGFTVNAVSRSGNAYGQFNIIWVWN
ncbi:MAG TPA: hypothetical protein VMI75_36595 [Polyangiaceae bacterium]|nr:hypothetical protein [Polyangiaceae bacterium]